METRKESELGRPGSPNPAKRPGFQVTWRRLSYESSQSTWDRCTGSCGWWRKTRKMFGSPASASYDLNIAAQSASKNISQHQLNAADSASLELGQGSRPMSPAGPAAAARQETHTRTIFKNFNGYIRSDELTAILGPSGAGKTSLLNAICGRTENYKGKIDLRYNASEGNGSANVDYKRTLRLSIIPQKDYLIENLTVYENLMYASKLLNCNRPSSFDHDSNIERVVRMLNLSNCVDSRVSDISGGEYKRVSIGQELLSQPDILILDEPTSGLDSLNCKNLVRSLNQLIAASRSRSIQPIAIVMTIHQPDTEIFQKFDHIYCLAKGGRVIFDGRPGAVLGLLKEKVGDMLRTGAQLAQDDDGSIINNSTNNDAITSEDVFSSGVNPANLLIEIASENIFGSEPIDMLFKFQIDKFEADFPETPDSGTPRSPADQLALNLMLANENGGPDASDQAKLNGMKNPIENVIVFKNMNNGSGTGKEPKHLFTPPQSPMSNAAQIAKSEFQLVRDKRLSTSRIDSKHRFLYQTCLLTQRAFKSSLRDPLMTLTSMIFHLFIPFVMWAVYSRKVGTVSACPIIEREIDMLALTKNETINAISSLQDELITALECSTMFFLSTYAFSMCSLSIAALAFPLNMHVLLKEVRNGWYDLSAFVIAKTLASFPFEVLCPVVSITMIYLLLGMPSSEWEWRLLAMMCVMALISMISHTQGLVFGALCMDSVQTAIFMGSALTLPQALLSGFTARINHMPKVLQYLSWASLYRYSSDSINIIRFGFGMCPCDSATDRYLAEHEPKILNVPSNFGKTALNILNQIRADETAGESPLEESSSIMAGGSNRSLALRRPKVAGINYWLVLSDAENKDISAKMNEGEVDLMSGLANMTARSFSFGRQIDTCKDVRSQLLQTSSAPEDNFLPYLFGGMLVLLVIYRIGLLLAVRWKLSSRI